MIPFEKIKQELGAEVLPKMECQIQPQASPGAVLQESKTMTNEITRFNYVPGIAEILELIKSADFVALDATVETTGLLNQNEEFNIGGGADVSNPSGSWWGRIKARERKYCLLEVGLAIFKWDPNLPDEIRTEVFNIPLLPAHSGGDDDVDDEIIHILVDENGQDFMEGTGFDISKSLERGAPFLNRNLCEKVVDWLKTHPEEFEGASSPGMVTEEERIQMAEGLKGVARIFEGIAQAGIPVVGHDLFLKMIFIYKDFIEYLPGTYQEYVEKMGRLFKLVYDTKWMAEEMAGLSGLSDNHRSRLTQLQLYDLFRNISMFGGGDAEDAEMFAVVVGDRAKLYKRDLLNLLCGELVELDKSSHCYEAGFDALVIAGVFLDLVSILQLNKVNCKTDEGAVAGAGGVLYLKLGGGSRYRDYYDMFMKGHASRFQNRFYGEPKVEELVSSSYDHRWEEDLEGIELEFENTLYEAPEAVTSILEPCYTLHGLEVESEEEMPDCGGSIISCVSNGSLMISDWLNTVDVAAELSSGSETNQVNPLLEVLPKPNGIEPPVPSVPGASRVQSSLKSFPRSKGVRSSLKSLPRSKGVRSSLKSLPRSKGVKSSLPVRKNQEEPLSPEAEVIQLDSESEASESDNSEKSEASEWEVEAILSKRIHKYQVQYWIKWKDHPHSVNSWEPEGHLTNCTELLEEFNKTWLEEKQTRRTGPGRGYTKEMLQIERKRSKNPDSSSDDEKIPLSSNMVSSIAKRLDDTRVLERIKKSKVCFAHYFHSESEKSESE